MIIAYASMTGNVERFVNKLDIETKVKVSSGLSINSPYVLITYTTGFGEVPNVVKDFLLRAMNRENLVAVIGSGNRNWGDMFCGGAEKVASQYNVPLLHKFELSGLDSDVDIVTEKIKELGL